VVKWRQLTGAATVPRTAGYRQQIAVEKHAFDCVWRNSNACKRGDSLKKASIAKCMMIEHRRLHMHIIRLAYAVDGVGLCTSYDVHWCRPTLSTMFEHLAMRNFWDQSRNVVERISENSLLASHSSFANSFTQPARNAVAYLRNNTTLHAVMQMVRHWTQSHPATHIPCSI